MSHFYLQLISQVIFHSIKLFSLHMHHTRGTAVNYNPLQDRVVWIKNSKDDRQIFWVKNYCLNWSVLQGVASFK